MTCRRTCLEVEGGECLGEASLCAPYRIAQGERIVGGLRLERARDDIVNNTGLVKMHAHRTARRHCGLRGAPIHRAPAKASSRALTLT